MLSPALVSSARADWNTPEVVLDLVRKVRTIGLDPCWEPGCLVQPQKYYRLDAGQDGAMLPWSGCGLVFCNPPYTRDLAKWIAKAADADEAIMLLPARTDTAWWHDALNVFDVVCMWRGRLTFEGAPHPAPFPSAIWYRGPGPYRFADAFAARGWTVLL